MAVEKVTYERESSWSKTVIGIEIVKNITGCLCESLIETIRRPVIGFQYYFLYTVRVPLNYIAAVVCGARIDDYILDIRVVLVEDRAYAFVKIRRLVVGNRYD